ncbi:hypothetical protein Naga_101822g1 [Nannochloropsis gaditana]|uniref:Uncharacterized protein n=1 Tax=Nannochloropsis gaditana TaxID=72520 RepID=W7TLP0_9STRA|nr:hypothetical protein Naga_101822g1 [Nannochloropsis gaditana]
MRALRTLVKVGGEKAWSIKGVAGGESEDKRLGGWQRAEGEGPWKGKHSTRGGVRGGNELSKQISIYYNARLYCNASMYFTASHSGPREEIFGSFNLSPSFLPFRAPTLPLSLPASLLRVLPEAVAEASFASPPPSPRGTHNALFPSPFSLARYSPISFLPSLPSSLPSFLHPSLLPSPPSHSSSFPP